MPTMKPKTDLQRMLTGAVIGAIGAVALDDPLLSVLFLVLCVAVWEIICRVIFPHDDDAEPG